MNDQPGLWDSVSTGLGIGASAAALIAAIWGFVFVLRRWWDRTVGRRRAQAAILDQLACTSSLVFSESKLGVPQFITHPDGREERIYRLPGAWVTVHPVSGAVRWFSITITDPEAYYDIGPITFGSITLRLGRDTFDKAPPSNDEALQIGARHATFVRHYDYGNQSGGQYYWLAFNGIGAGVFGGGEHYGRGTYTSDGIGSYGTPPDPSGMTVNTLTVMSPEGNPNDMRERIMHGPHPDQVALSYPARKDRSR